MGANIEIYMVKVKDKNELENEADRLRSDCRYDYGHSGYTGTIAEDNGTLKILDNLELTEVQFYDNIDEYTEKWEHSVAVKLKDSEGVWLIGGIYSC